MSYTYSRYSTSSCYERPAYTCTPVCEPEPVCCRPACPRPRTTIEIVVRPERKPRRTIICEKPVKVVEYRPVEVIRAVRCRSVEIRCVRPTIRETTRPTVQVRRPTIREEVRLSDRVKPLQSEFRRLSDVHVGQAATQSRTVQQQGPTQSQLIAHQQAQAQLAAQQQAQLAAQQQAQLAAQQQAQLAAQQQGPTQSQIIAHQQAQAQLVAQQQAQLAAQQQGPTQSQLAAQQQGQTQSRLAAQQQQA